MNGRERRWLVAAMILSVLLHAAVAWPLWNMTLGEGRGGSLFMSEDRLENQPVRLERSARDEIVGEEAQARVDEGGRLEARRVVKVAGDEAIRRPGMEGQAEIAGPQASGASMKLQDVGLNVGAVDVVGDWMAVDRGVKLPVFVGASDGVTVRQPSDEPIRVAGRVRAAVGLAGAGEGLKAGVGTEAGIAQPQAGIGGGVGAGGAGGAGNGAGGVVPLPVRMPAEVVLPDDKQVVDEHLDDDFEYVLSKYIGDGKIAGRGFELEIRPRESLKRLKAMGKDVVYVIDTSGSIGVQWLHSVKIGVGAAMDALNRGDRFNVVMFAEKVRVFDGEKMAEASDETIAAARKFIEQGTSAGYTDVNQALAKLVKRDVAGDRVYQIIFVSDGQPTAGSVNPRQIIDAFTRENSSTAGVYAVAVGDDVNRELLGALVYRNKGYVISGVNAIKCGDVMRDLASRLRYPILKDAVFAAAGVDARQMYPQQPRDIYQGDPVVLFGRHEREDQKLSMRMVGSNGSKRMDFSFSKKLSEAKTGNVAIMTQWAERKMHHLTAMLLREGVGDAGAMRRELEALKKEYGENPRK